MQQTLFLILAVSLWTIGIFLAAGDGELLHGLKIFVEKNLGDYWSNPFIGCPYCMPSFHSLIICAGFHYFYGFHLAWYWYAAQWIFVAASSSALNYILFNLIRILRGYADLFEQPSDPIDKKDTENE